MSSSDYYCYLFVEMDGTVHSSLEAKEDCELDGKEFFIKTITDLDALMLNLTLDYVNPKFKFCEHCFPMYKK